MPSLSSDTVGVYLKEIGRFPLLTSDQEITYARRVQQMIAVLERKQQLSEQLNREITDSELGSDLNFSSTEITQILHLGQQAKQKMVTANLRLVVSIAKKYHRHMDLLDLFQEGAIGLQRAVEKFDPNRGYKFSTYAYHWINEAITRAITQKSRMVRLPIHISDKLSQIRKVDRELFQTLGRRPKIAEIAAYIGLEPSKIREYLITGNGTISLDIKVGDERDTDLSEMLVSGDISPNEHMKRKMWRQDLNNVLAPLKPMQRQVLILRFGLLDDQERTLSQIGKILNISGERVRQIHNKAIDILRQQHPFIREFLSS